MEKAKDIAARLQSKLRSVMPHSRDGDSVGGAQVDVLGAWIVVYYSVQTGYFRLSLEEAEIYLSALDKGFKGIHLKCPEIYETASMRAKLMRAAEKKLTPVEVSKLLEEARLVIMPRYEDLDDDGSGAQIVGYVAKRDGVGANVSSGLTKEQAEMNAACLVLNSRVSSVRSSQLKSQGRSN